ncbi:MAG: tyrosine-type recombinase/integrase [Thermoleophilia bacterium]|nr:tyrosine-type recombinase/integrase [Thermoleophilia bacterium]
MSELGQAVEEYIALRRSLGFSLRQPARALRLFAAFMETQDAPSITAELALSWATRPVGAQPATWAWRLGVVRRFALWRRATDPRTEVPAPELLPHRYRRQPPHLFTDEEIERIIAAAQSLPSPRGLRAVTYATLFSLLAVTGMRVSEALALDRKDVDLRQGLLTIRRTKFGKSRLLPLHPSTTRALRRYLGRQDRLLPGLATAAFFISERGTRVTEWSARYTFAKLSQRCGLRAPAPGHGRGPRLHDMRHRFAVLTLVGWYRAGLDVERELPKLATYLGHVHVNETYWYLEAVPELLGLATERLLEEAEAVKP